MAAVTSQPLALWSNLVSKASLGGKELTGSDGGAQVPC